MTTSLPTTDKTIKILVIDDVEAILQVLQIHLSSAGYDVVCAECASDGVNLFSSGSFNLVITDYQLPDKSGLEVLRAVKSVRPDIPVMVMSGFLDADLISNLMKAGTAKYLRKPFLKMELLDAVAHILNAGQDA